MPKLVWNLLVVVAVVPLETTWAQQRYYLECKRDAAGNPISCVSVDILKRLTDAKKRREIQPRCLEAGERCSEDSDCCSNDCDRSAGWLVCYP